METTQNGSGSLSVDMYAAETRNDWGERDRSIERENDYMTVKTAIVVEYADSRD